MILGVREYTIGKIFFIIIFTEYSRSFVDS